jgi:hypothetical protein
MTDRSLPDRHLPADPPPDDAGRDPAEDRDSLLTAYALDELAGADRDLVERRLADPAADEARRIVAETRAIAAALRGEPAADPAPPSSDLRRAVIAALAGHAAAAGSDGGATPAAPPAATTVPGTVAAAPGAAAAPRRGGRSV